MDVLDDDVRNISAQKIRRRQVGPADRLKQDGRHLEFGSGDKQPSCQGQNDHQSIECHVDKMRRQLFMGWHLFRKWRWRVHDSPDHPDQGEEQKQDPDRFVKLKAYFVVVHVPAEPDHEQKKGCHHPVKGDGDDRVTRRFSLHVEDVPVLFGSFGEFRLYGQVDRVTQVWHHFRQAEFGTIE